MRFCVLFTMIVLLLTPLSSVRAQGTPPVQELHGSLAPGQTDVNLIEG